MINQVQLYSEDIRLPQQAATKKPAVSVTAADDDDVDDDNYNRKKVYSFRTLKYVP